jgi:large repetitive protein
VGVASLLSTLLGKCVRRFFAFVLLLGVLLCAGTAAESVKNGSSTTSEPFMVTVPGQPVIDSFLPTSGQPGTLVTLHGTNLEEVTSVTFNGTPAVVGNPCPVGYACPFAVVPSRATTGPITVTSAEGSFTTADVFTVIPIGPPVVSSFQPTSGMPGTSVNFSGTNFAGIKSVLFNGTPATSIMGGARPDGSLEADVPLGATTGPITVITDSGSYTTTDTFIVVPLPKPVITGFVPESAAPGSWINVMGTNFLNVQSVAFSGVESPSFSTTAGGINAKVPFAASGPITVVTPGGTAVSSNVFTVIGGRPTKPSPPSTAEISLWQTSPPSIRCCGAIPSPSPFD